MSAAQKRKARERWAVEEPLQKKARELRGLYVISEDDYDEYDSLLKDLEVKLALPKPPAMPVLARTANGNIVMPLEEERSEGTRNNKIHSAPSNAPSSNRQKAKALNDELFRQRSFHVSSSITSNGTHVERIAPRGHASAEWFACVHTPIDIQKALKIRLKSGME